jgi:hypothetical protein
MANLYLLIRMSSHSALTADSLKRVFWESRKKTITYRHQLTFFLDKRLPVAYVSKIQYFLSIDN